jgi:DNA-binding MarR family transcriptional regulator
MLIKFSKGENMKEEKNNLMEKLFKLNMLLHRHHHAQMCGQGPFGDPNRGQGRVLSLLKIKPEISQKELSYLLDMRSQSLGELLAKLEGSGYITKTISEEDRRVMDIKLTEKGREAADNMDKNRCGSGKFMDCLTAEEQVKFGEMLDKITEALEKELGGSEMPGGLKGMLERHKYIASFFKRCGKKGDESGENAREEAFEEFFKGRARGSRGFGGRERR